MNIKNILYTGTIITLLSTGLVNNTTQYIEAKNRYAQATRQEPSRQIQKINKENILSTTELEHVIEKQYDKLRNTEGKYQLTSEKEAVISIDYALTKVYTESGNKINAESQVGAAGLWQVMPNTWKHIEQEYDFEIYKYNPDINTQVGIKYLIELYDILAANHPRWNTLTIEQKQEQLSAAYNGGPNRLIKKDFDITQMPEETKQYVKKMTTRYPIIQNNNYEYVSNDIKQVITIDDTLSKEQQTIYK